MMYNTTHRLMRSRTDKILSGVSGGIARYLAVDPVFVRLAFVAIALSGVGLLIYPILWVIMPLEPETVNPPVGSNPYGTGAPQSAQLYQRVNHLDEGEEIPITNVGGQADASDLHARRKRFLGVVLVGIGGLIVINMIGIDMSWIIPLLFIGAGVVLLRRK